MMKFLRVTDKSPLPEGLPVLSKWSLEKASRRKHINSSGKRNMSARRLLSRLADANTPAVSATPLRALP